MKRSQLWIEGAQWVRDMVGQASGEQLKGICQNILGALEGAHRPPDFADGVRTAVDALLNL